MGLNELIHLPKIEFILTVKDSAFAHLSVKPSKRITGLISLTVYGGDPHCYLFFIW